MQEFHRTELKSQLPLPLTAQHKERFSYTAHLKKTLESPIDHPFVVWDRVRGLDGVVNWREEVEYSWNQNLMHEYNPRRHEGVGEQLTR